MFFSVVFLLGAIHGVTLAILLASKRVNRQSNLILGGLMLVFSLDLAMASFLGFGLQDRYPYLIGLDFPITFLYGPLLYLYTKSLTQRNERFRIKDGVHFLPFVLVLLYAIPFYSLSGPEKLALVESNGELNYAPWWFSHFKVLFNIGYIPFIIIELRQYKRALKNTYSYIEKRNLNWLQAFVIFGVFLAVVAVIIHALSTFSVSKGFYADLMLLSVTMFVYGIGYMGLRQPEFFVELEEPEKVQQKSSEGKSYSKSGLDEQTAKQKMEELKEVMVSDKPYLNSDLNLRDLADKLEISPHNLTEIINQRAGKNFYDFVNAYRVEETKERLRDPSSNNLTVLAMAMESGFNSKSSFNAVFKKHTGMTPTQYRKSLQ